ncbi:MAG: TIGR01777 family protein [Planctomycetes bacterium]|jgi:hypothetical protein|nr:TIGR01777 family protein [Planctomycetota bacterium]MDP6519308.1 TIGR01777 family oxidoreductase [Planctomycetota bacterium]
MHESATGGESKTLLIAGASGVIGRHVRRRATALGWSVRALTVSASSKTDENNIQWIGWEPHLAATGESDAVSSIADALNGCQAMINLAGSAIDAGRLGARHCQEVLTSRVQAGEALAAGLRGATAPPAVWIQASGVGFYGERGECDVTESDPLGAGLQLPEICRQWEAAGADCGVPIRRIVTRFGLVMASDARAFQKMMQPIRMGVGGRLGSGKQWHPWISGHDLARALFHLIEDQSAAGVFNLTAPEPIRQLEMTRLLAKAVNRPSFFPAPAFVLKAVLGGVASELLLPSCRARPTRLQASGFEFEYPRFEDFVGDLVGNDRDSARRD